MLRLHGQDARATGGTRARCPCYGGGTGKMPVLRGRHGQDARATGGRCFDFVWGGEVVGGRGGVGVRLTGGWWGGSMGGRIGWPGGGWL